MFVLPVASIKHERGIGIALKENSIENIVRMTVKLHRQPEGV